MKSILDSYRDIQHMIAVREKLKEAYELDVDYYLGKSNVPFQSRQAKYGIHTAAEHIDNVLPALDENNRQLEKLIELKNEIDAHINSLVGLEKQVLQLKLIDGLTYNEIAEILDYTPEYIRRIGARVKKK